ncbi:hypothetical protein AMTRI_Chr06g191950 [Amborella trichopoda]
MAPPLIVMESSDSYVEDLGGLVKKRVAKLLERMKVSFKGEIRLIEETIALVDIPAPRLRRPRSLLQKEAAELAAGLKYNPLSFGASSITRRGKDFRP